MVAQRVVEALNQGELYIFTHPDQRVVAQKRFEAIDAAFERVVTSPLVGAVVQSDKGIFGM